MVIVLLQSLQPRVAPGGARVVVHDAGQGQGELHLVLADFVTGVQVGLVAPMIHNDHEFPVSGHVNYVEIDQLMADWELSFHKLLLILCHIAFLVARFLVIVSDSEKTFLFLLKLSGTGKNNTGVNLSFKET